MKKNSLVSRSLSAELKQKGLTHQAVADILGKSKSTVSNRLSSGDYSEKEARIWSEKLGIPIDLFLNGAEPKTIDELVKLYNEQNREIESLKERVSNLEKRFR